MFVVNNIVFNGGKYAKDNSLTALWHLMAFKWLS